MRPGVPGAPGGSVPGATTGSAGPAADPAVEPFPLRHRAPFFGVGVDAGRVWIVCGRWSVLLEPRHFLVALIVVALSLAAGLVALRTGTLRVTDQEIVEALRGSGRKIARVAVVQWRLPRVVLALVGGFALGAAGRIFQGITRNPLGSPDLIGFSSGAQTGILLALLVAPTGMLSFSVAAFLGGAAVGALTFVVSLRAGGFAGLRFILVGIAISSMLVSLNRWLMLRIVDEDQALGALRSVIGTLDAATWKVVGPTCLGIAVVVPLTLLLSRHMTVLPLGEDVARALGSPTRAVAAALVLLGTILVALVTMAAGPIGFVALVAPHIARFVTGSPLPPLPMCGLVGSLLLIGSDVIGQVLLGSLPVGVVTNAVGGIYLMVSLTVAARGRRAV